MIAGAIGAAIAALTGCAGHFPRLAMPTPLAPGSFEGAVAWAQSTRPASHTVLRFHWRANQDHAGVGAVLLAPPDSIRLDYRGPMGMRPGSAAIVGDSALWAIPPDDFARIVPNFPLFWAMIGVAQPPTPGWTVARHTDSTAVAWRFTSGADTVDYIARSGASPILQAYMSSGGRPIGRVTTVLDSLGRPVRSRLDVLSDPARLDLTFDKVTAPMTFDGSFWVAPGDH